MSVSEASHGAETGVPIERIAKSHIRKEDGVAKVFAQRGGSWPWKPAGAIGRGTTTTGRNFVRPDSSECLHYYFYFMDAPLGLVHCGCSPAPFHLQLIATVVAGWRVD